MWWLFGRDRTTDTYIRVGLKVYTYWLEGIDEMANTYSREGNNDMIFYVKTINYFYIFT